MTDKDRGQMLRLDPKYYLLPPEEVQISLEDAEKAKRRTQIATIIEKRFQEKDLQTRLLETGEGKPSVEDVLNQGLFGFLPDGILLEDVIPQGEGEMPTDKINADSLWKHMSPFLDWTQQSTVLRIFRTLTKVSTRLEGEDEARRAITRRIIKQEHLTTLGDLRNVPFKALESLPGFGAISAQTVIKTVRRAN